LVFAGNALGEVFCLDAKTKEAKWKCTTNCGSALSMQYFDNQLYIVTTEGALACIDATPHVDPENFVEKEIEYKGGIEEVHVSSTVGTASHSKGSILVECVKESGKLRIRPVSREYYDHWNVQFPREIRKEGARYIVEELVESLNGGFYRAKGDIQMLSTATDKFNVLNVTADDQLNEFIQAHGFTFKKGTAFYEFTKKETIQQYKELVLLDKRTNDIFEGSAVRALLGLPDDQDVDIAPESFPKYKIFVQSASSNRGLQAGTQLLLKKA